MKIFSETLHAGYGQQFDVDKVLFEEKTDHFHLVIFVGVEVRNYEIHIHTIYNPDIN